MSSEDFEERLKRQMIRPIPATWRSQILKTAVVAAAVPAAQSREPVAAGTATTTPKSWWRELFWPSPFVWAGLACVWLVIIALQVASREPATVTARNTPPPTPEMLNALAEQRRLLTELIGPWVTPAEAPKPKPPGPSSECMPTITAV